MWRLLPVCLLAACVVTDPKKSASTDSAPAAQSRVLQVMELPIRLPQLVTEGEPIRRTFQDFNVSGWLDEKGNWSIRSEVSHGRIRCATYETGVQLGKGRSACSNVEWLTPVKFVTRVRHCNSAVRIHTGGGRFHDAEVVETANCARVVVRCEGC